MDAAPRKHQWLVQPLRPRQPVAGVVRAQLQVRVEGVETIARAQPELAAGLVFAVHFGTGQYAVEIDPARALRCQHVEWQMIGVAHQMIGTKATQVAMNLRLGHGF